MLALLFAAALGLAISAAIMTAPLQVKRKVRIDAPGAIRNGDLLLFSSTYKLPCDVQKIATGSQYTHSGVAFVDAKGVPHVFEVLRDEGSIVTRLEKHLQDPTYRCVVRHINKPIDGRTLEAVIRLGLGQEYNHTFWRGIVARWSFIPELVPPPMAENKVMSSQRCCSELVAATYARLGVLDFSKSRYGQSQVLPGDFSEHSFNVPLAHGYAFGPEYLLLPSPKTHVPKSGAQSLR